MLRDVRKVVVDEGRQQQKLKILEFSMNSIYSSEDGVGAVIPNKNILSSGTITNVEQKIADIFDKNGATVWHLIYNNMLKYYNIG